MMLVTPSLCYGSLRYNTTTKKKGKKEKPKRFSSSAVARAGKAGNFSRVQRKLTHQLALLFFSRSSRGGADHGRWRGQVHWGRAWDYEGEKC